MPQKKMKKTLRLVKRWVLGAQIGQGGFGRVFEAVGEDGSHAAVKVIPKESGSARELLFEDLTGVNRVVPIIDSGEWDNNWVLVMPRATRSLRDYLNERGVLSASEVVPILTDVATALSELGGKIIHRDIKPENVLLLEGRWCLSDFGIARYAEAATSRDTHKWAWSSPYNAPERWRHERASPASDVYSHGVMAFEMLSGQLPFPGPDFRAQHLKEAPPALTGVPALLASLIAECLFKASEARPSAANLVAKLSRVLQPPTAAAARLQEANEAFVRRNSEDAASRSAAQVAEERRSQLRASATLALSMISERLRLSILDNAPAAVVSPHRGSTDQSFSVTLGNATLSLSTAQQSRENGWEGWRPTFEVMAHATIDLRIPRDYYDYEGRSHSLWFCDAQEAGVFHWYETAFMCLPLSGRRGRQDPFALPPGENSGKALGPGIAEFQLAWPFTRITPGEDADFLERWMNWFAEAAIGRLTHPSHMPERPAHGTWRQS